MSMPSGVAPGAAPVGGFGAEQSRGVQLHGVAVVGVQMIERAGLIPDEVGGIADRRQELLGQQIDDPSEPRHQMDAGGPNPEEREILEPRKSFGGRMHAQVASARDLPVIRPGFFRPARQHDSRAFEGIARHPLVQHQRDPAVGENVLGVDGEAGKQQNR